MSVGLFGSSASGFALASSNVNLNITIAGANTDQVRYAIYMYIYEHIHLHAWHSLVCAMRSDSCLFPYPVFLLVNAVATSLFSCLSLLEFPLYCLHYDMYLPMHRASFLAV